MTMARNFSNTNFHVLSTSLELESNINAFLSLTSLTLKKYNEPNTVITYVF